MLRHQRVLTLGLLIVCWLSLVSMIFVNWIPFNVYSSGSNTKGVFGLFPQGWAFFTRSPREAQIQLWKKDEAGRWREIPHYHAHYSNFFGASRHCTRLLAELSTIYQQVDAKAYIDCKSNYQVGRIDCEPEEVVTVDNPFDDPSLCGEYLILCQEIVPWAWAGSLQQIDMDGKAAKIRIQCNG